LSQAVLYQPHPLVERVIGCAMEVHTALGPGLMESPYRRCFCSELRANQISFKSEVPIPLRYREVTLDCGYRADVIVEDWLIVEVKAVETVLPIHKAQLLTYLKLTRARQGLILNFNTVHLKDGIRSVVSRDAVAQDRLSITEGMKD